MSYKTPEAAARGEIPRKGSRVVAVDVAPGGHDAVVILALGGPEGPVEQVSVSRQDGAWEAGISGSPSLWRATGEADEAVGVLTVCGWAPQDARAAVIGWSGERRRAPVRHGYFLFVVWDVRADDERVSGTDSARLIGFEIGRRLLFMPDYTADPLWDLSNESMVSLDGLPVSEATRASVRAWAARWEALAWQDIAAEQVSAGRDKGRAPAASEVERASVVRDKFGVWSKLREDLGPEWQIGMAVGSTDPNDKRRHVQWEPDGPSYPCPPDSGGTRT